MSEQDSKLTLEALKQLALEYDEPSEIVAPPTRSQVRYINHLCDKFGYIKHIPLRNPQTYDEASEIIEDFHRQIKRDWEG